MQAQQLEKIVTTLKWLNRKEDSVKNLALLMNWNVCMLFYSFKNYSVPNIITLDGLHLQTVLFTRLKLSNEDAKRETLLYDFSQAICEAFWLHCESAVPIQIACCYHVIDYR